jgi:hypothetical protein
MHEDRNKTIQLAVGEEAINLAVPGSVMEIGDWDETMMASPESATACFDNPIDYPPLSSAFLGGDRIALAVEPGFAEVESLVTEVVGYFIRNGAQPAQIHVLLTQSHAWLQESLTERLRLRFDGPIAIEIHDDQAPDSMGYLAADHYAEPIYINRTLLDADFVLPISCARDPSMWAYTGLYGIVPWFTDSKTHHRWRQEAAGQDIDHPQRRIKTAKEVAWLLGIQPVLAVVPGPHGRIDSLYFGNVEKIEQSIERAMSGRKISEPTQLADLLVATIDGDRDQQSWDNVARILFLAERFLHRDGSIAVITDLDQPPGAVFRWLSSAEERESTERHLLKSSHPHALAAIEILRSQTRHKLYLMSRLPSERVEEWGMAAIENTHELEHLIRSHERTVVISGAQHRRFDRQPTKV